jgi:transposase
LKAIFRAKDAHEAQGLHDSWLKATAYCRIAPIVAVEKKVRRRRADVIAAVNLGTGNGCVESINNKIKVGVRMSYGFRNIDSLVSLLMLRCSDEQPAMPWEDRKEEKRKRDERKRKDRERDRKRRKGRAASAA